MADHPCGFRPFVLRLAHAEQVDEPIEIGLQVRGVHAGEAPQVALEPRAQVVDHLHGIEVGGIGDVGLVGLRPAAPLGDDAVVGALLVVHDGAALREVGAKRRLDPLGRRLAAPAHHRDRVLASVDGDRDAQLLPGQPALAGLPVALGQVGVVDVDLVDPDPAAEHNAVLVAPHRGEDAVAPLEGRLVGDAAQLGSRLDRDVPGHELDEANPCREILLAVLENRARHDAEARTARGAPEPAVPGGRPAVLGRAGRPAARACGMRPERLCGLVEAAVSHPLAARASGNGLLYQREVAARHSVDFRCVGVAVDVHSVVPSTQAPTWPGRRQT